MQLSYVELSKRNLFSNIKSVKSLLPRSTKIACVVKANAYGHGLAEVVKITEKYTDYFQVDDYLELIALRKITKKPALVLGYAAKNELKNALQLGCTLGVYDISHLAIINRISAARHKPATVHIKIDALLGRQGVMPGELKKFVTQLKKFQCVKVEGIYSHFSNIEDTASFIHAKKQIEIFKQAKKIMAAGGFHNLMTHLSATSGILEYENKFGQSQLVRLGIGLYGLWPSLNLRAKHGSQIRLKPVLSWITHMAQVKTLPPHHPVGYGLTYVTSKPTKIAVIPQGYSDGYDRGLSNIGEVLIQGKCCPVLGRVAMNMFVVDVSDIKNLKAEAEVVLLGQQGKNEITAEEIAKKLNTINYEITTRISPLLPRVIKN